MFTNKTFTLEKGLIVPMENVATIADCASAIVVQLAQPYMIGSIRLLLWDCDDRSYSYYVEVSTNQQQWTMVADRTKVSCKCYHLDGRRVRQRAWGSCHSEQSWQSVTFERQPASFIRIVGTHNTANEGAWASDVTMLFCLEWKWLEGHWTPLDQKREDSACSEWESRAREDGEGASNDRTRTATEAKIKPGIPELSSPQQHGFPLGSQGHLGSHSHNLS
uniref:BTB domain containing 9 n=1 Tax=Rousettus aegyptiacus TaxID=9407 RepID=A0A7J8K5G1_ROUAE|nr:BTB domain containing 9 [Rousettus aegyptiacus]